MVLYFTGTGNSKYIADLIAEKTGGSLYSVNSGVKNESYPLIDRDEVLIFSLPTYAWRMPKIVSDWIEKGTVFNGQKAYFIMNCGSESGNAEKYIKQLCLKKNLIFMGCAEITMPENYIAMFDCPDAEKSAEIIKDAEKVLEGIIPMLMQGSTLSKIKVSLLDKIKSSVVNEAFYSFFISSKKFESDNKCISCGKCRELCAVNNIKIENGKPVWGENCTHCMACISYCPVEAIEYGKISLGKRRYKCPDYKSEK